MDLRERIINAAIDEFQDKGLRFTMDDVARRISISKKTLYQAFSDKESMLLAVADYCFADIKRSERAIVEDENMPVTEKISRIMVVLPERYQNIGLSNLYQLKEKYPRIYGRVAEYLETDWDATIMLLEKGIEEGSIRNVSVPIVKAMVESTYQHFFSSTVLRDNGMDYETALREMIEIIMNGIVMKDK